MSAVPAFDLLEAPERWQVVDLISDLHLKAEEPGTFEAWARYMRETRADAVLILGDLFEAWVGDDAAEGDTFEHRCAEVLRACKADLAFMRGNRDFLVGKAFLGACGIRDLADPTLFTLGAHRIVLTHGDLLCTADVAYQAFRRQVRAPAAQQALLARPLAERRALAASMRAQSEASHGSRMTPGQTWTDTALVRAWLAAANAPVMIHGHTHLPADHALGQDDAGRICTQVVLSDWHVTAEHERTQILRLKPDGSRTRLGLSAA